MAASKPSAEQLITDNIDVWTSAIKKRGSQGRGSSKKNELYGIKKLRELILELAVRGLLVPQDPSDEPASVLLEKIADEKEQLIKEGKIKKQKPLPEITEEEKPFSLPNGWEWARLGNVVHLQGGFAYKSPQFSEVGTNQVIRMGNIRPDDLRLDAKEVFIDHDLATETSKYKIENGDVLITMTGTKGKRDYLYSLAVSEKHLLDKSLYLNQRMCMARPLVFNSAYLNTILKGERLLDQIFSKATGTANQANVGMEALQQWIIPIAPLEMQARLEIRKSELMALCDQLEQQTETSLTAHQTLVETLLNTLLTAAQTTPANSGLESSSLTNSFDQAWNRIAQHFDVLFTTEHSIDQLKQTILQLAVMGKLVPQDPNDEPASVLLEKIAAEKEQLIKDKKIKKQKALPPIGEDEKPFELPKGWEWCRLPDIGDLARGKSKHRPRNDRSLYVDGKIPLVQTGDVSRANGVIETYTALYNETGLAQSRLWPKGTMCITIAANIADTSVLGFDACFPDSVVGYTPFDKEIDVRYFEFFIRTAKSDLEKYAPSTAQKNINLEILSQVLVPFPPKEELSRVVTKIVNLMAICDSLKIHIRESQTTQLHLANAMAEQAL